MKHEIRASLCVLTAALALLSGCAQHSDPDDSASVAGGDAASQAAQVPVRVDKVRRQTMNVTVAASGRTEALRQDRIRAPFASRIVALRVADGDRIERGQVVAVVVAKNSEAALVGAQQMLAAAHGGADKADAQHAVELVRKQLVQQSLRAPDAGVVLSHAAETGDYVDESEVLVTIADAGSVIFNAQVAQSEADRVHVGQAANILLPAIGAQPIRATVHGALPLASSQNFSIPILLDFASMKSQPELGLYGEAHIVTAQHADAAVVPQAAVLRDDISGVSRVAIVKAGVAHWLTVQTGIRQGDQIEILSPVMEAGTDVIVDGQVGLPDGAKVTVQP